MESSRRTGLSIVMDVVFVVFTVAVSVYFVSKAVNDPSPEHLLTSVGVLFGFGLMAVDRFWLRRRRATRAAERLGRNRAAS